MPLSARTGFLGGGSVFGARSASLNRLQPGDRTTIRALIVDEGIS